MNDNKKTGKIGKKCQEMEYERKQMFVIYIKVNADQQSYAMDL